MSELKDLQDKLSHLKSDIAGKVFVAGFDGFIDQMINVVDTRSDLSSYDPVPTMMQFGKMIQQSSNRSSLREVVIESVDIGGCAVNIGDGLAVLGGTLDFYGSTGIPMAAAFGEFAAKCRNFTPMACDPGLTMAFEFEDGKYMMSSVSQLAAMDRKLMEKEFSDGRFLASCREADLIALTNWTLYPHMSDCWSYVQESVFSKMDHRPYIFIDLVDPRSRSDEDIAGMLEVLGGFEKSGRTIFGGNLNEGNVLGRLLGLSTVDDEGPEVARLAADIRKKLGISMVALHCIAGAAYADETGSFWAPGPYCAAPFKSTGAGDRFNAGFAMGTVLGLQGEERLSFAGAVSGFFVRKGYSGTIDDIIELIGQWDRGELE